MGKRIALFLPDLEGGGAEHMMVNLANALAKRNLSVDLVLASGKGPFRAHVDDAVRVVDLVSSITSPGVIWKLSGYLSDERPDTLLSAMTYPNVAAIMARFLGNRATKIVISERVTLSVQARLSRSLKEKLKPFLARLAYPYADRVVAISRGVAEDLSQTINLGVGKIEVIHNPVVTERLFHDTAKPEHPFFGLDGIKVVLAVGRLVRQKGFETLLAAFKLIVDRRQDIRLVILGEGPLRAALSAEISRLELDDYVSLPGYSLEPCRYMRHADLFVLSSLWEGFGNVLVEAMASGCPVVSTNCPSGPAEILENGRYGRLVSPGDSGQLCDAIADALEGKAIIDKNALVNRARQFDADSIADYYLDVL